MKRRYDLVDLVLTHAFVAIVAAGATVLGIGLVTGTAVQQPDPVEQCIEEALDGTRTFTEDEIRKSGAWYSGSPETICAYVVGIEERA